MGCLILKILGIVVIVSGLVGLFIYLLNVNWGCELGILVVICGGVVICLGFKGWIVGG